MPKMPLLIPTKTTSSQLIASDMVNQELNYANLGDILGYRTTSGALRRIFTDASMVRTIYLDQNSTQTINISNDASGNATGFIAPVTVLIQRGSGFGGSAVDCYKTVTLSHGSVTPLSGSLLCLLSVKNGTQGAGYLTLANNSSSTVPVYGGWTETLEMQYISFSPSVPAERWYVWQGSGFNSNWRLLSSNEINYAMSPSTMRTMSATALSSTNKWDISSIPAQRTLQCYYRYNDMGASVDCGTNNIDTTNRVAGQMTTIDVRATNANTTLTLPSGNTYEIINTISSYRVIPITNTANERTKITLLYDGARFHVNYANYRTA